MTTAGIYALLQRPGLKRVVISRCPFVTLDALAWGGHSQATLKVVTEPGSTAAAAASATEAALGGAAGMAGPDMQLLVADV